MKGRAHFFKLYLTTFSLIISLSVVYGQSTGFYVQGKKILDAYDNEFIMRGINHPHAWNTSQMSTAINAIAKTKANCVRIVLSNGRRWSRTNSSTVQWAIDLCKQNKMVAVLEVHDCTGYTEQSNAAPISTAVDYWLGLKNVLFGEEKFVIINIANEPYGNNATEEDWINGHKTAIKRLREGGFSHLLMVDGANWGQDWSCTMQKNAQEVFDSDSTKNIMFSVHMYEVYSADSVINRYLHTFDSLNLPLVVGEFAKDHGSGKPVDAQAIMDRCTEFNVGYIGWAWRGNGGSLQSLNISYYWSGGSLTPWGELLVNGRNGIKSTSKTATIFLPVNIQTTLSNQNVSLMMDAFYEQSTSQVKIQFSLDITSDILLQMFDLRGKTINYTSIQNLSPGSYTSVFDAMDRSSGNYIVQLSTENKVINNRIALTH